MEKSKTYHRIKFSARVVRDALNKAMQSFNSKPDRTYCSAAGHDESWRFDDLEEFFASYSSTTGIFYVPAAGRGWCQ